MCRPEPEARVDRGEEDAKTADGGRCFGRACDPLGWARGDPLASCCGTCKQGDTGVGMISCTLLAAGPSAAGAPCVSSSGSKPKLRGSGMMPTPCVTLADDGLRCLTSALGDGGDGARIVGEYCSNGDCGRGLNSCWRASFSERTSGIDWR